MNESHARLPLPLELPSLGSYLREQREHAKLSLRQLADLAGVSNPYLSQVERGLRRPSAEVLQQIARGLQISAEVLFVRAGILDESRAETPAVETALATDPYLSARQRNMLLDLYRTFREQPQATQPEPVAATPAPRSASGSPAHTAQQVPPAGKPIAKRINTTKAAKTTKTTKSGTKEKP